MDKLKAELPGVLNWALAGCLEWQKGKLRPPERVLNATRKYRADMDVVKQFLEDCAVEDRKAEETVKALYEAYTEWCQENGETAVAQKALGQRLDQLGYKEARSGRARKRRGIRLKRAVEFMSEAEVMKDANEAGDMSLQDWDAVRHLT